MKVILLSLFVALFMVGCGEKPGEDSPESNQSPVETPPVKSPETHKIDLSNDETRKKIIAEAIDLNKFQKRFQNGEELLYLTEAPVFPEQIRVDEVTPHFPTCTELRPSGTHTSLFVALDKSGSILGQVGRTSPHADSIVGYQGPVDSLLILETNGTLKAMKIRASFENQPYTDYPNDDAHFSSLFQGRSIAQLADMNLATDQVEGVSGATMTSMAMAEGIVKTARQWEQLERTSTYTGWAKDIHHNGPIKVLAQFKDGKRDGFWIEYYENGQKNKEGNYKDGEQHGLWTGWYVNGKKRWEKNYKDGKPISAFAWKPNGEKYPETNVKDGNVIVVEKPDLDDLNVLEKIIEGAVEKLDKRKKPDGSFLYYQQRKLRPYTGWRASFWDNGQIEYLFQLKDGKQDGLSTEWYENGQKKAESIYKDSKLVSILVWKPNGEKCPVTNVRGGSGVMVTYNEDGTVSRRITIKDGKEVN